MASVVVQCPDCGAIHSFQFKAAEWVGEWDIRIPGDWKYGQWDRAELYWVLVPLPVLVCTVCRRKVRLRPSFLLKGTRLTLDAVVFVTFAREVGGLTWRAMPEMFCTDYDKCAHSTLYIAVHKMGRRFSEQVRELSRRFHSPGTDVTLDVFDVTIRSQGFSAPTSHFRHTLEREMGARHLVVKLLPEGRFWSTKFSELFYQHVDTWNLAAVNWKEPLPRIYGPYRQKARNKAA